MAANPLSKDFIMCEYDTNIAAAEKMDWVPRFRFAASYDMFTDEEGAVVANKILSNAVDAGKIVGYEVLCVLRGYFGLQSITFTFDVDLPDTEGYLGLVEVGSGIACELMGDSDGKALGVTLLNSRDEYLQHLRQKESDEALAALREKLTGGLTDEPKRVLSREECCGHGETSYEEEMLENNTCCSSTVAPPSDDSDFLHEPLAQWEKDLLNGDASDEDLKQDCVYECCEPALDLGVQDEELNTHDPRPGQHLCHDDWSGRYFYGSADFLEKAVLQFNQYVLTEGEAELNMFYDLIGLPPLPMGADHGWNSNQLLQPIYGTMSSAKGIPTITLAFRNEPKSMF